MVSKGYVYVANGEGYVAEATKSAISLKKVQPDAKICILTNDYVENKNNVFDIVQKPSKALYLPIDKTCAHEAPFGEVVFLDTDTYVISNISEIFEILSKFDIAALQALQRGWDYPAPGVPKVFSEYNTGVIVFRNNEKVKSFFSEWRACHEKLLNENIWNRNDDQPAFRITLFKSDLRVASLPSEYHFRGHLPNFLMWDAKLIHCRGDQAKIANIVNSEMGLRVHIPNFGVYGMYSGKTNVIKRLLKFTKFSFLNLIKPHNDVTRNRPKKWQLKQN